MTAILAISVLNDNPSCTQTFFLWGHLVAGPNWRASIGTAILLLAPTGIFLGFVAPYVARHVHAIILVFRCTCRNALSTPARSDSGVPACMQLLAACTGQRLPVPYCLPRPWHHPSAGTR
jgi:hypothetical protein